MNIKFQKINALENLVEDEVIKFDLSKNTFETEYATYLVLTDNEAEEKAIDEIECSLWAFNPEFIVNHMKNIDDISDYEKKSITEALSKMQSELCENANAIVKALIKDIDDFIYDAIEADGRGHFISFYDGKEIENQGYYIYRID